MIELRDIKPFPCLPGATVVAVDTGGGNGTPGGETSSSVEMRATETHIQWRVADGAWTDLIALSSIAGTPGPSVELQASETHIQWRISGGEWADLVPLSAITGPAGTGGGSALTPSIVYVSTSGDDATGEIGNSAKPFATAQGACSAIAATPSGGNYSLKLGVGSFGGVTYTNALASRLKSIFGEGPNVSLLGGINAAGAPGSDGDPNGNADGNPGQDGVTIVLNGDGSVNLGDIILNGGAGGSGVQSSDGEIGGSGGQGGNAGSLRLHGFTVGNITAHGAGGGIGSYGNTSIGNGGGGGSMGALFLYNCIARDIETSGGLGGSGMMDGAPGSDMSTLEIAWSRFGVLNNPSAQSSNPDAFIFASMAITPGNASVTDYQPVTSYL